MFPRACARPVVPSGRLGGHRRCLLPGLRRVIAACWSRLRPCMLLRLPPRLCPGKPCGFFSVFVPFACLPRSSVFPFSLPGHRRCLAPFPVCMMHAALTGAQPPLFRFPLSLCRLFLLAAVQGHRCLNRRGADCRHRRLFRLRNSGRSGGADSLPRFSLREKSFQAPAFSRPAFRFAITLGTRETLGRTGLTLPSLSATSIGATATVVTVACFG